MHINLIAQLGRGVVDLLCRNEKGILDKKLAGRGELFSWKRGDKLDVGVAWRVSDPMHWPPRVRPTYVERSIIAHSTIGKIRDAEEVETLVS